MKTASIVWAMHSSRKSVSRAAAVDRARLVCRDEIVDGHDLDDVRESGDVAKVMVIFSSVTM